jgi:hypothetical protein
MESKKIDSNSQTMHTTNESEKLWHNIESEKFKCNFCGKIYSNKLPNI